MSPVGKLDAAARHALPRSDFALPGKGAGKDGKGSGAYPIPDKGYAEAALSRVAANGTSSEKRAVRAHVAAKFPGMVRPKTVPTQ